MSEYVLYHNDPFGNSMSYWHDFDTFYDDYNSSFNDSDDVTCDASILDKCIQMVVEIEANTTYKMEVSKEMNYNPIILDRVLDKPMPFDYGSVPKTYEDPDVKCPILGVYGDNDPLDICNISSPFRELMNLRVKPNYTGDVIPVKIIGILRIIDSGYADWKLVGIDYDMYHDYVKYYDKFNVDIVKMLYEWFCSDPKYEQVIYHDLLSSDNTEKDISLQIYFTVINHSRDCYKDNFSDSCIGCENCKLKNNRERKPNTY